MKRPQAVENSDQMLALSYKVVSGLEQGIQE
eukprot:IDg2900t1